jgi:hypothetical protein
VRAGIRDERRESRAEWRRAWRAVPYADQRRVRDALRRGREVDDPGLAPVAVEVAERRLRGDDGFTDTRYRSAISVIQALIGLAWLASGIAHGDTLQIVLGVALAAIAAADLAAQRIERVRLRRAAEANRALAGAPRYPADET